METLDPLDQSCLEHDEEQPQELVWAHRLEPSQIDGLFWCQGGSHYVRVTKEMLPAAIEILARLEPVLV